MTDTKPKSLYTMKQFMDRYYELVPDHPTYKEAYQALEKEHEDLYGVERYASYSSFRVVKNRYLKK